LNNTTLIKKVYSGIRAHAIKRASNASIAKDFLQEGLIAAFEVIKRYSDKPENEIIKLMGTSARNRINTILVKEINWSKRNMVSTVKKDKPIDSWIFEEFYNPEELGEFDMSYEEVIEKGFLRALSFYLEVREKKILREKLSPSKKTVKIFEQELAIKIKKQMNGKLVMNVNKPEINNTHIAKSLGLSKATVSRAFKNIQEVVLYLNNN